MNRENAVEDYAVSLDIGNASVGWAAFTPNYRLVRAKGHELIGARLFEPASTAEERRMARTTRRLIPAVIGACVCLIRCLIRRCPGWIRLS